jgi:hypothetical protein
VEAPASCRGAQRGAQGMRRFESSHPEEAVSYELVSGTKFPANREINREFLRIRAITAIFVS